MAERGAVLFESVLKDVDFQLDLRSKFAIGWWILKFENGAIIRTLRPALVSRVDSDIWRLGKKYKVTKYLSEKYEAEYLMAELIED